MIRSCGTEEPCLPVCRRQVVPHAEIPRCINGIGDGTVNSDRSVVVLHHFGLGRGYHRIPSSCLIVRVHNENHGLFYQLDSMCATCVDDNQ